MQDIYDQALDDWMDEDFLRALDEVEGNIGGVVPVTAGVGKPQPSISMLVDANAIVCRHS